MKNTTIAKHNGFVSIIAATVLMVLVSLVSIGFLTLMQREQRQALDRQLSSQAFYAAETAVNDAYREIKAAELAGSPLIDEKEDCDVITDSRWNGGVINNTESNGAVVTYTCLQYDQTPNNIVFTDSITTQSSKVFTVEPDGVALTDITISWNGVLGNSAAYGVTRNNINSNLPRLMAVGQIPVLRVDIIPVPIVGFDRESLINGTGNYYLYPTRNASGVDEITYGPGNVGPINSGTIVNVECTGNPGDSCELTIRGLASYGRYYVRVKSIYQNVKTLDIIGNGGNVEFKNAQILVDATGKANDVLRRIDVRLSDDKPTIWPEAVLEASEGFCKKLSVVPGGSPSVGRANCYTAFP